MANDHYLVLARRWRPQTFGDVVGQEHITRTLRNAIGAGRIGHAFLFIGSRGVGKTTSARILAKCLNCVAVDGPTAEPCGTCDNCVSIAAGTSMDVIEIDGASNNSVDDVRQIRENIRMVPASSRYKIYVIDEVHQLSTAAFNALLKTLEEPPAHAVFILATTESHKIPATIISRCQRYDFRRVGLGDLIALLRKIVEAEGVACSDEALHAVARAADGGVRDAESILDQLMSYCDKEITYQDVYDVLGLVDRRLLHDVCRGICEQDVTVLLRAVDEVVVNGKDLSQFAEEILRYFRNLLVIRSGASEELLALPEDEVAKMTEAAGAFTLTELIRLVEQFSDMANGFESQLAQRTALEALLIRLSKRSVDVSVDSVLEKLAQLGGDGAPVARASAAPAPKKKEAVAPESKPAPPSKAAMTDANREQLWQRVMGAAAEGNGGLGAWLQSARAKSLEGEVLVLELGPQQEAAYKALTSEGAVVRLETALKDFTTNVTGVRVVRAEPSEVEQGESPADPSGGSGSAQQTIDDPAVARVMDVFKGRIVDIQRDPESAQ